MVLAQRERRHPGVQVVLCEVRSINQFVRGSWVRALSGQDVYVGRTGPYLLLGGVEADGVAILVKQLDPCETNVVLITPCVQDAEGKPLASGKFGDEEGFFEEVEALLETKRLWLHLGLHRLTRLHLLRLYWLLLLDLLSDWEICHKFCFFFSELVQDVVLEGERTLDLRVLLLPSLGTLGPCCVPSFHLLIRLVPAFSLWSYVLRLSLVQSAQVSNLEEV